MVDQIIVQATNEYRHNSVVVQYSVTSLTKPVVKHAQYNFSSLSNFMKPMKRQYSQE